MTLLELLLATTAVFSILLLLLLVLLAYLSRAHSRSTSRHSSAELRKIKEQIEKE